MSENGTYVSRAELAAHIKGIDEHFDVVENLLRDLRDEIMSRPRAWTAARPYLMVSIVTSVFTAAVSFGVAALFS